MKTHTNAHIPLYHKLALLSGLISTQWVGSSLWGLSCPVSFCTPSHPSYASPYGFLPELTGKVQHWIQGEHQMSACWMSKCKSANLPPGAFAPATPASIQPEHKPCDCLPLTATGLLMEHQACTHAHDSTSCFIHLFPLAPGPTIGTSTHPHPLCGLESKFNCTSVRNQELLPPLPALRAVPLPPCTTYPAMPIGWKDYCLHQRSTS